MQNNSNLQVLSFVYVTKLKHIENLIDSPVEYIHFDSSDNLGRKKKLLVDESVFSKMGKLKYSFLQENQHTSTYTFTYLVSSSFGAGESRTNQIQVSGGLLLMPDSTGMTP